MLGLRKAAGGCWARFAGVFTKRGPQVFGAKGSWVDVGGFSNSFWANLEEYCKKSIVDSKSAKHFSKAFISFDFCLS